MAGIRNVATRCMTIWRLPKRTGDAKTSNAAARRLLPRSPLVWRSDESKARRWCARCVLQCLKLRQRGRGEIGNGRHAVKSRHCLDQDFLSLAVEFGREHADTCCIALGAGQRLHQSRPDHIVGSPEDRIDCVARCAARVAKSPLAKTTSTSALTSSAANSESRSAWSANACHVTVRFWPSMKPSRRRSQTSRHNTALRVDWRTIRRDDRSAPPPALGLRSTTRLSRS